MTGIEVAVWLSSTGLGLLALPQQAVAAFATATTPVQTVSGLLGAVDGGAQAQGWYLKGKLAAPMVVNLGALNLTWARSGTGDGAAHFLGVKLGVLNTTVPMICDGQPHTVLQLDAQSGDYALKLSRVGGQSDTLAARVEYTCRG